MTFETTVLLHGKSATGLEVPPEVVAALGGGRRPAVRLTVGGYTYRTTLGAVDGAIMAPLSAENRARAGVDAGDTVVVDIELDTEPREVSVPTDLTAALSEHPESADFFETLPPSHRKEWVRWIEEAKRPETRQRRVAQTVAGLAAGRRAH